MPMDTQSDKKCPRGKLHCFNYLSDVPGGYADFDIVEVQFKNTRKGFYRNSLNLPLETGDMVAVEASPGHDIGKVTLTGRLVALQMKRAGIKSDAEIKRVFRKAKPADLEKYEEAKSRENDTMIRARKIAESLLLNMKIGDVEYQGDGNKAIFYYIADERVDFRQLIKVLAETFKVRIEMKQIGARTHRRHRPVRTTVVLLQLDDQFRIRSYKRGTISGHIAQSSEARRAMCQAEMLSELRSRHISGKCEETAATRNSS